MSDGVFFQSLTCTLSLKQLGPRVFLVTLTGDDANHFGDRPFRTLESLMAGTEDVELYIDAREGTTASIDVSGAWARWLGKQKPRFAHVSMLTGSRFIQISADLVKRFSKLGETMRLYTDARTFDDAVAQSLTSSETQRTPRAG